MRFLFSSDLKPVRLVGNAVSLSIPFILVFTVGCASRPIVSEPAPASAAQKREVSDLVPNDLSFAKGFVQFLVDSGWIVQTVRPSKLNGFFRETRRAAWIDTDKGILEVVFFENDAEVDRIQLTEERSDISTYHKYVIQTAMTTQRMEGGAAYFMKHGRMFIVTSDARLNESLKRLFAS